VTKWCGDSEVAISQQAVFPLSFLSKFSYSILRQNMSGALSFYYFDSITCKVKRRMISARQET